MAKEQKPPPKDPHNKPTPRERIAFWCVVIIFVCGLWFFYQHSPRERPLDCDGSGGSLITFGSCRER